MADLFAAMEEWKPELEVTEYSISQVTLEQVFLSVTHDKVITPMSRAVTTLPH